MTVEVTAKDIAFGRQHEPCSCPIALALSRVLPPDTTVRVDSCFLNVLRGSKRERMNSPAALVNWIRDFDFYGHSRVQPASFEIDFPDWAVA